MKNTKKHSRLLMSAIVSLVLLMQVLTGCKGSPAGVNNNETAVTSGQTADNNSNEQSKEAQLSQAVDNQSDIEKAENNTAVDNSTGNTDITDEKTSIKLDSSVYYTSADVPEFDGYLYVTLDGNMPLFSDDEKKSTENFEKYSELDSLRRCGPAYANICRELMPTQKRGSIGSVKPTGWHTKNYHELVDGNYLYNRCHLIAFELAGENANVKNLITGTRYFNVKGMLPYENKVAQYVKATNNHVLYRVTPVFEGDNLVATGARMEGWSVEDKGAGICFNIFVYNVQPGIAIDYTTGDSWVDDSIQIISDSVSSISQSTGKTKNNTGSNPDNNTAGNDSTSAGEIAAMAMGAAAIHEAVPDTAYETDGTDISDNTDSVQSFEAAEEEAAADTSGDSFAAKEETVSNTQENNSVDDTASTDMVWVASSGKGKKYHSDPTCSNMKNPVQITKQQAEAQGKGACSKCY